jgi:hypothetical protein
MALQSLRSPMIHHHAKLEQSTIKYKYDDDGQSKIKQFFTSFSFVLRRRRRRRVSRAARCMDGGHSNSTHHSISMQ